MGVTASVVEAQAVSAASPLMRDGVHDETRRIPLRSFYSDLNRKVSLKKVMGPAKEQDEDELLLKPDVNYRYASNPDISCGACRFFVEPGSCAIVAGLIRPVDVCDEFEPEGAESEGVRDLGGFKRLRDDVPVVQAEVTTEVTPPGYEPVVKALKRSGGVENPWAVAWWMKGQGIRPRKKSAEVEEAKSIKWVTISGRRIPIEQDDEENGRLIQKFTRRETPEERAKRIAQKRVDPETASAVRRLLKRAAVQAEVVEQTGIPTSPSDSAVGRPSLRSMPSPSAAPARPSPGTMRGLPSGSMPGRVVMAEVLEREYVRDDLGRFARTGRTGRTGPSPQKKPAAATLPAAKPSPSAKPQPASSAPSTRSNPGAERAKRAAAARRAVVGARVSDEQAKQIAANLKKAGFLSEREAIQALAARLEESLKQV